VISVSTSRFSLKCVLLVSVSLSLIPPVYPEIGYRRVVAVV
jgi:hypothetical protein